jgi:hypothetical protein
MKMTTLVIHAPKTKVESGQLHSFQDYFKTGIGIGYIIAKNKAISLIPPITVVLLDKDQKLRAEGNLIKIVPTRKTPRGKQRYDVHFNGQRMVPYKPESIDRYGVSIF